MPEFEGEKSDMDIYNEIFEGVNQYYEACEMLETEGERRDMYFLMKIADPSIF